MDRDAEEMADHGLTVMLDEKSIVITRASTMTFSGIKTAIDILCNRLPGALAMLKAKDISISVHSRGDDHWCTVNFYFDGDVQSCGNAFRAIDRLYEMNRPQHGDGWSPTTGRGQRRPASIGRLG